jgi:uncharacterized protein (TIGR01777 family)
MSQRATIPAKQARMKVAITGASGLLGRALAKALKERGDEPVAAKRSGAADGALKWDVKRGFDPPDALSGFDAVVHLAGENVGDGRWTDARKQEIIDSRVDGTRSVLAAIEAASPRPRVLVSASAVGIYRDDTAEPLDESGPIGRGFLSEVVQTWEAEARKAEVIEGVRVVIPRIGVVLSRDGGALAKMLTPFKLGVGGRIGDGTQPMPWVHIDDVVASFLWLLDRDDASGIYNVAAPNPIDNATFTRALGKALHRPTFMPVPTFALRVMFGEMADVVLHGQRAVPRRLLNDGFAFTFTDLDVALRNLVA